MSLKICSKCSEEKDLSGFARGNDKDGLDRRCRACVNEHHLKWYHANKERRLDQIRAYKLKYSRSEKGIRASRNQGYKSKYGITLDDYERMFEEQSGLCAICAEPPEEGKALQVDHDHETGQVRRLLCWPCNVALGFYRHNPTLLRKAAEYLEEFAE